jgi:hypothetical protein
MKWVFGILIALATSSVLLLTSTPVWAEEEVGEWSITARGNGVFPRDNDTDTPFGLAGSLDYQYTEYLRGGEVSESSLLTLMNPAA